MSDFSARFPSGRLVLVVLILSIALWSAMVFGTLAHLSGLAGGLTPFDMRPFGYTRADASEFLGAIGEQGIDFYKRVQLRLDLVYPALYALSRALAIWWLTQPGRIAGRSVPIVLRGALLLAPVLAMIFDYRENALISAMLAAGTAVAADLVGAASLATQIKSFAGTLTELTAIMLAATAFVGWRQRTAA
jgi:hypothetical protein